MPEGIRIWGERAAAAGGLDATLGVITMPVDTIGSGEAEAIACLPAIREAFADWAVSEVFPYAPVAGVSAFRDRWREWILAKGSEGSAGPGAAEASTRPVATVGVTGGLAAVSLLLLEPGDEVLVPDPRWDGYDTTLAGVAGASLVPVSLLREGALDVAAWERALHSAARRMERVVCVLNFPHNPTGYVPTREEVAALVAAATGAAERTGRPVVVICDDAYEGFVHDAGRERASIFFHLLGRHPRVLPVKLDGITKELLFWGGRLGAVTTAFPPEWGAGAREAAARVWENKLSSVVRGMVSSASTAVQTLIARLLEDPVALRAARAPALELLGERYRAMREALETPSAREAFRAEPFHGGLFALLNLNRGDAVRVATALVENRGIGVVPFRDRERGSNALRITYATLPAGRIGAVVEAAAEEAASA